MQQLLAGTRDEIKVNRLAGIAKGMPVFMKVGKYPFPPMSGAENRTRLSPSTSGLERLFFERSR